MPEGLNGCSETWSAACSARRCSVREDALTTTTRRMPWFPELRIDHMDFSGFDRAAHCGTVGDLWPQTNTPQENKSAWDRGADDPGVQVCGCAHMVVCYFVCFPQNEHSRREKICSLASRQMNHLWHSDINESLCLRKGNVWGGVLRASNYYWGVTKA